MSNGSGNQTNQTGQTNQQDDQRQGIQAPDLSVGESLRQALSSNAAIQELQAAGIPVTRKNVIDAYTNDTTQWGADDEAGLPEHLQDWDAFQSGPYNHED